MTAQQRELTLTHADGTLDLFGANSVDGVDFSLFATADGTDWGNPESVRRVLRSAIANGSLTTTERYDNRTITVRVKVEAVDGPSLAAGERVLMLATGRRAELTWTPPANLAAPCVFVVVNSDLRFEFNDLRDHIERIYVLTLEALPFTRSVDPVVIEALPSFVATTPTVLDDCLSVTGWATLPSGTATFAVGGGGVEVSSDSTGTNRNLVLTKTFARAKRYLAVELDLLAVNTTADYVVAGLVNGSSRFTTGSGDVVADPISVDGKWVFFDVPHALGSITQIRFAFKTLSTGGVQKLARILTIAEADSPALSAGRQSLRIISTPGSALADGSLLVQSRDATNAGAGTALGQVIVYTGPQYDPRLSPIRSAGAVVDSASLSGKATTGTSHWFTRNARDFPTGSYALWANIKGAAGTFTTTVTLEAVNPTSLVAIKTLESFIATVTLVGTGYNLLNLGELDLPGASVETDSNVALRVTLTTSASRTVDEVLVFNRSLGSLTIVDTTGVTGFVEAPTGTFTATTGATRVWLEAASLDRQPLVIAGRAVRSDCLPVTLSTQLRAWDGEHLFHPDATYLYVGTTSASDPMVTGEFAPAWHTHPVE